MNREDESRYLPMISDANDRYTVRLRSYYDANLFERLPTRSEVAERMNEIAKDSNLDFEKIKEAIKISKGQCIEIADKELLAAEQCYATASHDIHNYTMARFKTLVFQSWGKMLNILESIL